MSSVSMRWHLSHRFDPRAVRLADKHYSRQKPGTPQFVPPGRCVVLLTERGDALWVTSWPFAEYTKHRWAGAWVCSLFRNESAIRASTLIREAVAATRFIFGEPPALGMVTFIDPAKVRPIEVVGYSYRRAKFVSDGTTQGGLFALRLSPNKMPAADPPQGAQWRLVA